MAPANERGTFDNYELFRWLQVVKQTIEENSSGSITITASQVTSGVFDPARIPDLPFTRIQLTGRRLLGRSSDGLGDAEEIQVAGGLSLAGGILSMAGLPSGFVIGDLLYAQTATQLARLADVSVGSYLRSGGVATAPLWSTLKLPNAVTAGSIIFASATDTYGQNNAKLFWDDTFGRLGVGTIPSATFDLLNDVAQVFFTTTSATAFAQMSMSNSFESLNLGVEGSAGGELCNGSFPHASVLADLGGTSPCRLQFGVANALVATFEENGNFGLGVNAPTAVLHLKAGTTAASTAPLKFTSGSLLTSAEAGAVEFLTDAFYGTITTGVARKRFVLESLYASNNGLTMATSRLLGRTTAGTGNAEELSVSSPLSLSAGALSITGASLTKTDDTNVTLSLGGSPTTALLAATSLTLGWTGTLSLTRGGLGFNASGVAKGGVFAGTGAGTVGITTVGADGTVLTADAASAGGVKWATAGAGTVTGSGTSGTLPKWTSASALGDSLAIETSDRITVTKNANASVYMAVANSDTTNATSRARFLATSGTVNVEIEAINATGKGYVGTTSNHPLSLLTNGTEQFLLTTAGDATLIGLLTVSGAGTSTFGPGGTAATNAAITINGSSASGRGALLTFQRNSVDQGYVSTESNLLGNTSNAIALYGAVADGTSVYAAHASGALRFYSGGTTQRWGINAAGDFTFGASSHIALSNGTPTIASGFGTGPSIVGTDYGFTVTVGTGGVASTGLVNLGHTFNSAPSAVASSDNQLLTVSSTTTQVNISTGTIFTVGSKINVIVFGY